MQHYVCTGDCAGENTKPGMCDTSGCSKEGLPLTECKCDDGFHQKVVQMRDELDVESMDDQDGL